MKPGKIILAAAMAVSLYTTSIPDVMCHSSPNNRSALEQSSLENRVSQTAPAPSISPATAQRADDNAIRNIINSTVNARTTLFYEDPNEHHKHVKAATGKGTGILLKGNYFLTSCRTINPLVYYKYPQEQLKEIRSEYFAEVDGIDYSLEKVVEDVGLNFSLMKFTQPPDFKKNEFYKCKLGESLMLHQDGAVYVVRDDFSSTDLRIVSAPVDTRRSFLVDIPYIQMGDRGRFVFVDDKEAIPCLVGMISEVKPNKNSEMGLRRSWTGYVTGIEPIIEKIRQYSPKIIEELGLKKKQNT